MVMGKKIFNILFVSFLLLFPSALLADQLQHEERYRQVLSMYLEYAIKFPAVDDIDAAQLLNLQNEDDVVFIDTRKKKEMKISMIPGAITEKEFLKSRGSFEGRMVVAYCTIGYRSGKLAKKMAGKGIKVFNLKGGLLAWLHEGGKLHHQGIPTNKVHVYGKKWDLAPSQYDAVY